MIVILKENPDRDQLAGFIAWLEEKGIQVHTSVGENHTILGLIGDTSKVDIDLISALDIVADFKRVQEPYKNANRKFHPHDTVVRVGNAQIGGGTLTLIAGPCSVESEEQIISIAKAVKASGATLLRGGAFKPRTSPYSFQGLQAEGIRMLKLAREETGLPIARDHGRDPSPAVRGCRRHPGRRAQHAKLQPAQGLGSSASQYCSSAGFLRLMKSCS